MNAKFTGLGAERNKVIVLVGLMVLAVATYFYFNSSPASTPETHKAPAPVSVPAPLEKIPGRPGARVSRGTQRGANVNFAEFRPSLKPNKDIDRVSIDPTLHLDILDRLQNVKVEGVSRSLFESAAAPPVVAKIQEPAKIIPKTLVYGPPAPPKEVVSVKPPDPPPPPVPLKFYGFIAPVKTGTGPKRAFFLDGEDIIVAAEGQLIKNRYKIVRIGVNSAVVADTQFKDHESTLPLVEEQQG